MPTSPSDELRELARSYGVQLEYVGMDGRTVPAPAESLLAVLRALGADVASEADVPRAILERRDAYWRKRVEPVVVAWDGVLRWIDVRLPVNLATSSVACRFANEAGEETEWTATIQQQSGYGAPEGFVLGRLGSSIELPAGYHRLRLEFQDGQIFRSLIISAPTKAYQGPNPGGERLWGVFCPVYALHGEKSWGAGDFSDLEALMDWTAAQGGKLVASLPMLASTFDGQSPIISPYSPTSRLCWNEFYLDLNRIPELARSEAAQALLDSSEAARDIADLQASEMVDYGRQMRLKRRVFEQLANEVFYDESHQSEFLDFVSQYPNCFVGPYAFFQALGERHGRDWRAWREDIGMADADSRAYFYHNYAQWQVDKQLRALSAKAREKGLILYLDFPIGVDFNSFDVWYFGDVFATGASVGCPPDPTFTKGQNWGFPPLHPDRQRESGYAYLIASIRSHLQYANALRIDHVMGLHRLFWIPQGAEAKDGAFVSTPSEEIYAILSVESHRNSAWLVGEDLGTVPPEVEGAMRRHNVRGMYVVQYEVRPDQERPLREPPETTVASLNTHDMPPFAAFWAGMDIDDRKDLGLITDETVAHEKWVRQEQRSALIRFLRSEGLMNDNDDVGAVLPALWKWLAASPSSVLLLNLEDLWLETESQNTPNTYDERPNWRRKLRQSFEQFANDPAFLEILRQVDELRARPSGQG